MRKKPPSPARHAGELRGQLEALYLRRQLIEHLIRSMERYSQLEEKTKGCSRQAA